MKTNKNKENIIDIRIGSFNNKGDGLMLLAIVQNFSKFSVKLSSIPSIADYSIRSKLGLYQTLSATKLSKLKSSIAKIIFSKNIRKRLGLILEDEITIVVDSSGYKYGDNWGKEKIVNSLKLYKRLKKNNSKILLLPQTFGPFFKTREIFEKLAENVDLICARDKTSFNNLKRLSIDNNKIRYYPDFTRNIGNFSFENITECIPKADVCIIPNHRMLDELGQETADNYKTFLLYTAKTISNMGKHILFIFHEKEDEKRITNALPEIKMYERYYHEDPLVLREIISNSQYCVSSRFHGVLTSFSNNVPCIGTSWSHKFDELYEDFKLGNFLIDPSEIEKLSKLIDLLKDEKYRKIISKKIEKRGIELQLKVDEMWDEINLLLSIK